MTIGTFPARREWHGPLRRAENNAETMLAGGHVLLFDCSSAGELFDGRRVVENGLFNFAVPNTKLEKKMLKLPAKLLEKNPIGLKGTEEVLRIGRHLNNE